MKRKASAGPRAGAGARAATAAVVPGPRRRDRRAAQMQVLCRPRVLPLLLPLLLLLLLGSALYDTVASCSECSQNSHCPTRSV